MVEAPDAATSGASAVYRGYLRQRCNAGIQATDVDLGPRCCSDPRASSNAVPRVAARNWNMLWQCGLRLGWTGRDLNPLGRLSKGLLATNAPARCGSPAACVCSAPRPNSPDKAPASRLQATRRGPSHVVIRHRLDGADSS